MTLNRSDKEFRHPGVSYLDYKQVEMDRVLTGFLPRLWWGGSPSVLARSADLTVDDFVETFLEHPKLFSGFDEDTTRRWAETHLLDVVNRGKAGQAVAGLRPLHGFTYRFRNARRSRPYGADEQLYAMIYHAAGGLGRNTLTYLKDFFFAGVDPSTETRLHGRQIDVETQALINLSDVVRRDVADRRAWERDRRFHPPLYPEASNLLAEDIVDLLFHKDLIPRSALVDYLKILFAFHLALYHLRITKLLPALVRGENPQPDGAFFLDVAGIPGTAAANLAERSAAVWFGRIPDFVRATFVIKKLDEFAVYLTKLNRLRKPADGIVTVTDLLALLDEPYKEDREQFGAGRLRGIVDRSRTADEDLDTVISQIVDLGLDPFTTYIEVITAFRVRFHRKYFTECLDTLLLKNRPGAMIAQPRRGERRFVLDARLLEVLLQIALLRQGGDAGLRTTAMRVDEFLAILRGRYGLYIDRLPSADGFDRPSITDHMALRENTKAFTARLREIGFYSDLSDAYLTQTITPRYVVKD
ncbi:hypothetical protein [Microbispora sp. NBRC 16548]|uniref:methylation-associated defense system protein MAD7 n=1 Tax=Microbispora sp. NBRC 16548 TaxID=3030994 RepID=UPI0024A373D1|nr:hypothetical protein [Microbispora sp. NBRC 16548]GLX05699.1 hypothetical protein Misp03_26260 [Microbispora sp. NBRC 16548]